MDPEEAVVAVVARAEGYYSRRPNPSRSVLHYGVLRDSEVVAERLQGIGLTPTDDFADVVHGVFCALVKVRKGECYHGPLTLFNEEEELQFLFYDHPADSYSVRAFEVARPINQLVLASASWSSHHTLSHASLFRMSARSLMAMLDCQYRMQSGVVVTGGELLLSWGIDPRAAGDHVLALAAPYILGALCGASSWTSLMLLGRWRCDRRLFDHWPSSSIFRRRKADNLSLRPVLMEQSASSDVSRRLFRLSHRFRETATLALQSNMDEDDRASLHQEIESDIVFLSQLAASMLPCMWERCAWIHESTPGRFVHPHVTLVHVALASMKLKYIYNMRKVFIHAIKVCSPPLLVQPMLAQMKSRLPSEGSVRKSRFWMDVAFSVHMREETAVAKFIWIWADSSPQGAANWLLTKMHILEVSSDDDLLALSDAIDVLSTRTPVDEEDEEEEASSGSFSGGASVGSPTDIEDDCGGVRVLSVDPAPLSTGGRERLSSRQVSKLTRRICSSFSYHCLPVAALGSGAEKLENKVHAIVHQQSLESHDMESCEKQLSACISFTTDMGTELGLADTIKGDFGHWLDSSLRPDSDIEGDLGGVDLDTGPELNSKFLFGHAIPVSGCLHILNNATGKLLTSEHLQHWDKWKEQLDGIGTLLARKHAKDRFTKMCLKNLNASEHLVKQFDREFSMPAEWRWGTLFTVLLWLIPLSSILIGWWDGKLYLNGAKAASVAKGNWVSADGKKSECSGVDVHEITKIVQSKLFWAYAKMLLCIEVVLHRSILWMESCPCHQYAEPSQANVSIQQLLNRRRDGESLNWLRKFKRLIGSCSTMFDNCPMAGKWAPYMATGKWKHIFRDFAALCICDLENEMPFGIAREDRNIVLNDF